MDMNRTIDIYTDLKGRQFHLSDLDTEERALVEMLIQRAEKSNGADYANFYMPAVSDLYSRRGLSRREIIATPVWRIAQDLWGRIAIKEGWARAPDYRDELEDL